MPEAESRLSTAMEQRRVQLRMTWVDVAKKAGLSIAGLSAIRRGERNPTSITRAGIEDALQWASGSIDAVLAGGDPMPVQSTNGPESEIDEIDAALEIMRSAIAELERIKRDRAS